MPTEDSTKIPETIYLQVDGEGHPDGCNCSSEEGYEFIDNIITWNPTKLNQCDIEYRLAESVNSKIESTLCGILKLWKRARDESATHKDQWHRQEERQAYQAALQSAKHYGLITDYSVIDCTVVML